MANMMKTLTSTPVFNFVSLTLIFISNAYNFVRHGNVRHKLRQLRKFVPYISFDFTKYRGPSRKEETLEGSNYL